MNGSHNFLQSHQYFRNPDPKSCNLYQPRYKYLTFLDFYMPISSCLHEYIAFRWSHKTH